MDLISEIECVKYGGTSVHVMSLKDPSSMRQEKYFERQILEGSD